MKSAMWRNIIKEIKTTFSRFMAIFVIMMLGVSLFTGLKATSPIMKNTADHYFDRQNLMDIRIVSTYGFSDEDAAAVREIKGIRNIQPSCSLDALVESSNGLKTVKILSMPDDSGTDEQISRPVLVEGRLPEKSGECLLDKGKADTELGMIGSKIVISGENNSQTLGMFHVREFTITGIVESPAYISIERGTTRTGNGRITGFVIIPKKDLNSGYYTEILATVDGAKDLPAYSDEYSALVGETIKQLDNLAQERENIRYGEIIKDVSYKMGMANIKPEVNKAELDKIKKPEWYIMDRNSNPGYTGFGADTERIDAITTVFPLFFFLVAALVCLTTMTRMVEEQRTQIGILKALGYSRLAIASKYLIYAGLACILGSIFGIVSGFLFFPSVIFNAYRIMYTLPPAILSFDPEFAAISSFTAILCTAIATLAACYHELLSAPAELIRPKAPAPGRRVVLEKMPIIWNRLSFLLKVTARNLFRYKKRFFVTVFGVAGCTALLLTGFGLRDSIMGIVSKQFGDIHSYDMIVSLTDSGDIHQKAHVSEAMEKITNNLLYVMQSSVDITANGKSMAAFLIVPEDSEKLNEFVSFRERVSDKAVTFPQPGRAILSEKLATLMDVSAGDEITVISGDAEKGNITVGGITENYIEHYIYLSPEDYSSLFGEAPSFRQILCKLPDVGTITEADEQSISEEVMKINSVSSVFFTAVSRRGFDDTVKSLESVVILTILCASLLAFVVLYNLTNINITERIREIATIKVLGFFDQEVSSYVFRENAVLTVIGILLGLAGGVFLHRFVVQTSEVDIVMFEREIRLLSYFKAVAFTLLFAGTVHFIMYFKLRKISMVESLKSTE